MELIENRDELRTQIKRYLNTQKSCAKEMDLDVIYLGMFLNGKKDIADGAVLKINKWLDKKKNERSI